MSILLDAGPSLNFLAAGQQNILVQLAASRQLRLAAPERVDREVRGKAREPRFARTGALNTWQSMAGKHIEILSDDLPGHGVLTAAVTRVSGIPAAQRVRSRESLGEIMVLAHASVYAQDGHDVYVLIDERDGRWRAGRERRWLIDNKAPGSLTLWTTPMVLRAAAEHPDWIAGDLTWEKIYDRMRRFDDGLPPRPPCGT